MNFKTPENTYAHCELMVDDKLFMAISEAPMTVKEQKEKHGRQRLLMCMKWVVRKLFVMHMRFK